MSEEEKTIIFAEHFIKDNEGVFVMGKKETQILLNIIKKQQEEIDTVLNYIEELEVNNYEANNIINDQIELLKDSTFNSVIRDKIEELNKQIENELLTTVEVLKELLGE
jgi:hypothetical protein